MDSSKMLYWYVSSIAFLALFSTPAEADHSDYITTQTPMVLLSVNGGEIATWPPFSLTDAVQDSITVIHTYPDARPIARTYDHGIWGTIAGSPRAAILGRYGIVTNHEYRPWAPDSPPSLTGPNQIVVVDLETQIPTIVQQIELSDRPRLALAHPDGNRLVVAAGSSWLVYQIDHQTGVLTEVSKSVATGTLYSFDLGRDSQSIIATMTEGKDGLSPSGIYEFLLHEDMSISMVRQVDPNGFRIEDPFSPLIDLSRSKVYVLNGRGFSDRTQDDILVIGLDSGKVEQSVTVCDGIESFAIHPTNAFGVAACLNDFGPIWTSHLAVVDLSGEVAKVLSYTPVEHIPEGMEFSPDGEKLFVGAT